jgi:hypothetical protein
MGQPAKLSYELTETWEQDHPIRGCCVIHKINPHARVESDKVSTHPLLKLRESIHSIEFMIDAPPMAL